MNWRGKQVVMGPALLAFIYLFWQMGRPERTHRTVHEVSGNDLPNIHPFKCIRTVPISPEQYTFIQCLKPLAVDQFISGDFEKKGMYEKKEVELIISLTSLYPEATFLDMGANIGTFSSAVAATKYNVVAVDPVETNLAYIRTSAELSGNGQYIRYILNAVSDDSIRLYPWKKGKHNEGGWQFLTKEEAATKEASSIGLPVDSATFEDITSHIGASTIILKIDVEGSECKALNGFLQNKNKKVFIPFIYMEWFIISTNGNGGVGCPNLSEVIQGFQDSGYSPYSPADFKKLSVADEKAWQYALWVHAEAFPKLPAAPERS